MPFGRFTLLKNIPLDSTYIHTLYFPSEGARDNFLAQFRVAASVSTTYVRVDETNGKVKVEFNAVALREVNYIILENTYESQTQRFYCFVTNIEYLNDKTSEVTFEVDVLQTYLFKWTLNDCTVERCHTRTDQIGEHTLPEPIQVNEPIVRDFYKSSYFNRWSVVMFFKGKEYIDAQGQPRPINFRVFNGYIGDCGMYINNLITNVDENGITVDAAAELELFNFMRDKFQDLSNDFVTAILYPTAFIGNQTAYLTSQNVEIKMESMAGMPLDFQFNGKSYTPKNNKMLCYPYNYFELDSPNGQIQYKYENAGLGAVVAFKLYGTLSPNASIACRLENTANYKEDEIL